MTTVFLIAKMLRKPKISKISHMKSETKVEPEIIEEVVEPNDVHVEMEESDHEEEMTKEIEPDPPKEIVVNPMVETRVPVEEEPKLPEKKVEPPKRLD